MKTLYIILFIFLSISLGCTSKKAFNENKKSRIAMILYGISNLSIEQSIQAELSKDFETYYSAKETKNDTFRVFIEALYEDSTTKNKAYYYYFKSNRLFLIPRFENCGYRYSVLFFINGAVYTKRIYVDDCNKSKEICNIINSTFSNKIKGLENILSLGYICIK